MFQTVEAQKEWTVSVKPAHAARYVKIGLMDNRALITLKGVRIFGEAK